LLLASGWQKHSVCGLVVCCDSLVVVSQVNGEYVAKDERMAAYLQLILSLKFKFPRCDFKQVPRSKNNHVDSLVNLVSVVEYQFQREIPVEYIAKPSIHRSGGEVLRLDTSLGSHYCLPEGWVLSNDRAEAQKFQYLSTMYILLGDVLYKNSYSMFHSDPSKMSRAR